MMILVINAGSSSLKYQLFDMDSVKVLAKGLCERIGLDGRIKHTGKEIYEADVEMPDHAAAIRTVISLLLEPGKGVLSDMNQISAVGHRVVHGGEHFSGSVLIDDKVLAALEECIPLAPLHNPPNLVGIRACTEVMGQVPQVAVFDTAFHQTMPKHAYLYALPYDYYEKYRIRRYGFHGTSHRYVAQCAAQMLGKSIKNLTLITCHLGNGSSITAIQNGKSIDTSMGFTPLDGVPMGTRSGVLDPAILEFISQRAELSIAEITAVLNKQSGVLGISGVSSDFRDLHAAAAQGNTRAQNALDIFAYSVKKYIGAYAAAMGGADAVIFTAGVGENNAKMRAMILEGLDFLGFAYDPEKNQHVQGQADISAAHATGKVLVIPTNEELVIAQDTLRLTTE